VLLKNKYGNFKKLCSEKKKKLSRGEALGFKKGVPTFDECIVFLYSVSVSSLFHDTSSLLLKTARVGI
jgi:hypothetical protein